MTVSFNESMPFENLDNGVFSAEVTFEAGAVTRIHLVSQLLLGGPGTLSTPSEVGTPSSLSPVGVGGLSPVGTPPSPIVRSPSC